MQCGSKKFPCCGMVICGFGKVDEFKTKEKMRNEFGVGRDACILEHKQEQLACGHTGCNFRRKGCFTFKKTAGKANERAKVEKYQQVVKTLMGQVSSKSLKHLLSSWLQNPEGKFVATPNRKRARGD